jgi:hypothetical protein
MIYKLNENPGDWKNGIWTYGILVKLFQNGRSCLKAEEEKVGRWEDRN